MKLDIPGLASRLRAYATAVVLAVQRAAVWLRPVMAAVGLRSRRLATVVARRVPLSCFFGLVFALLGGGLVRFSLYGEAWLIGLAEFGRPHLNVLGELGVRAAFGRFELVAMIVGIFLAGVSLLAFVRRRFVVVLLRMAAAAFAVVWVNLLVFLVEAPARVYKSGAVEEFGKAGRNELWVEGVWAWVPLALVSLALLVATCVRQVGRFYGQPAGMLTRLADRLVANLRTHGDDPRFRKSLYAAATAHIGVLFVLPLIVLRGCMQDPYGIPKGSGDPIVQMVQIKKIKKKPKERVALNLNSPILFYRPDIDESKVLDEIDEETLNTYEASPVQMGKAGQGAGKGGWPNGMADAKVRFIRLEYRGGDWDQDMGVGSDYNLLLQFHKLTGFKIASDTEHIPIRALRRFPEDRAPPFVFMTGRGNISVSSADVKTLRWYCMEEGGLIFADNGGGHFDRSFRRLMGQVFPEKSWVDIPSDDLIFRQPCVFPDGVIYQKSCLFMA